MLPLSMSETRVNKELLLITTTSQVRIPQTIVNIGNMIVQYLPTSSLKNTGRAL